MARNGKECFAPALAGLLLSTAGALLYKPMLSLLLEVEGTYEFPSFLLVYAYLFVLNPLTFFLNMLLVFLHVFTHAEASKSSLPVFLMKHLPRVAFNLSFAALLFGTPLLMHAAVNEESIILVIEAMLACTALVSVLTSVFKKVLITCCHAGKGFIPAFFSLCTSTVFFIFLDLLFTFPNSEHPLIHTELNYLLLFIVFFIFMLGITPLILCIGAPATGNQALVQAKHLAIVSLSVAFAVLLISLYIKVYVAITDMAAFGAILSFPAEQ